MQKPFKLPKLSVASYSPSNTGKTFAGRVEFLLDDYGLLIKCALFRDQDGGVRAALPAYKVENYDKKIRPIGFADFNDLKAFENYMNKTLREHIKTNIAEDESIDDLF